MSTQEDRITYVTDMARELGIIITPEDIGRVAGVFGNLARAAAELREADMGEDTLPASTFQPITNAKK